LKISTNIFRINIILTIYSENFVRNVAQAVLFDPEIIYSAVTPFYYGMLTFVSVMLLSNYKSDGIEAGCDEAGRGCLAGPVFAAAVILPSTFRHPLLNDSKKLSHQQRAELKTIIEAEAISYAVAMKTNEDIDQHNILRCSIMAMHDAVKALTSKPDRLLIDGNRFYPYDNIPHHCIIKGDGKYMSIAAASILAKTHRDQFMENMDQQYPGYGFAIHKGYPTSAHREAISKLGPCILHRKTFRLLPEVSPLLLFE